MRDANYADCGLPFTSSNQDDNRNSQSSSSTSPFTRPSFYRLRRATASGHSDVASGEPSSLGSSASGAPVRRRSTTMRMNSASLLGFCLATPRRFHLSSLADTSVTGGVFAGASAAAASSPGLPRLLAQMCKPVLRSLATLRRAALATSTLESSSFSTLAAEASPGGSREQHQCNPHVQVFSDSSSPAGFDSSSSSSITSNSAALLAGLMLVLLLLVLVILWYG
uniref:Uncharacterized protein n=1 Tax=Lotharella globosa TaxID=91324 RepID=A0A7S3ZAU9_9EUKA